MRQLIIIRKDLHMSSGKACAMAAHGSNAWFMYLIKSNSSRVMDYGIKKMRVYEPTRVDQRIVPYRHPDLYKWCKEAADNGERFFYIFEGHDNNGFPKPELVNKEDIKHHYKSIVRIDEDIYDDWINGIFTKTVCEAKNKNHLLKAVDKAKELGLEEGKDFFLIKDNCLTELEPEEVGADGIGRTLTCIGFRPLPDEVAHEISRKYQLYK